MEVKYKILKGLDVSGFAVFDPIVRLAYGEEPKKQLKAIGKFIIVPIVFILICFAFTDWIAPKHKTKSGQVPDTATIRKSAKINHLIAKREGIKSVDFLKEGADREQTLLEVQALIAEKTPIVAALKAEVTAQETAYKAQLDIKLKPIQDKYDELKAKYKEASDARKEQANIIAAQIYNKQAASSELVSLLKKSDIQTDIERAELDLFKTQLDEERSEKYEPLELARNEADSQADALLFLKTREDLLTKRNRSVKVAEAEGKKQTIVESFETATSESKVLSAAKDIVRQELSIERLAAQKYAPAATIYLYIQRSVFTVIIGFLLAIIFGIPLGILCGLNKVFMACMTPIIAIFKPVSPVVWLLIFQIIVGAFFPNPDTHPLFVGASAIPWVKGLGVNPAMVFSACTVAMCALWPSLVNTALGVCSIDPDHINVARVLRLNFWERLTKIIIPSALPLIFAGLRISMGVGWMVLIAAEALSSSDGLGKFVWDEYQNGSSLTFANIMFACFVIGIIGFILDRVMIVLQRIVSFDDQGASV